MAWNLGSDVAIDDSGNISAGSGIKLALYQARVSEIVGILADPAHPPADWDEAPSEWPAAAVSINADVQRGLVSARRNLAKQCNGIVTGLGQPSFTATCGLGDLVGACVALVSPEPALMVTTADPPTAYAPAIGIIESKPSLLTCVVRIWGPVLVGGLSAGLVHYVGADGRLTPTRPVIGMVESLGFALSSTEFFITGPVIYA